MGLALTKQAINHVEDLAGKRTAMDAVFARHHFAHTHNELLSGDKLGGYDARPWPRRTRSPQEKPDEHGCKPN